MRILITGAGGFIGSHLMDALEDHDVWGFDNFLTGVPANNKSVIRLGITERKDLYLMANVAKPDLVIHCAASYSDPDLWHRDTDVNVAGAINVAAIARHHAAQVIYFQTILPPVSSYAISKLAAEQYLRLSGVPLTVFRMANIYGPRNLSGPIPVFYKRISEGKPCLVVDTTRDMVFITDLVRAVRMVVDDGDTGTFDVCSGEQVSIMDLYIGVARVLGHTEVPPLIPPDPDDVQGVISTSNGLPHWKAQVPLRDGIYKTVSSYHEKGIDNTYTHLRIGEKDAS